MKYDKHGLEAALIQAEKARKDKVVDRVWEQSVIIIWSVMICLGLWLYIAPSETLAVMVRFLMIYGYQLLKDKIVAIFVVNGEMTLSPFTYDLDLNLVCPDLDWSDYPTIVDQEVRDGVTWYKYHVDEGYDYWLPEHNGADWEQVYKKYIEEPYNAKYNSMSDEEKVNEMLMAYEQVWNKTYYNVVTEGLGGTVHVTKCYAYKNADGSITQSADWEWCDSSIFNGTSLPEHGSIKDRDDGVTAYWKYDGNTLIDNTEYNELTSELYYHLIDLYGEECVRWNDDNRCNGETLYGFHDWDVYGDGKDACRSREVYIAKCQGN